MANGRKTKRWALIGGGLALFGAGAAAGRSGAFAGLTNSLSKLKPAVGNVANKFLPQLGGLITGDRPVTDYLPNRAAIEEALSGLYGTTRAGQDAKAEAWRQYLGGLISSPITWVVVAVLGFLLLRRKG